MSFVHLEFTLIYSRNLSGSLDIGASRVVLPIEIRSPEFSGLIFG